MSNIDPERATKRELIVAAQKTICPTDVPAKQWQTRFAIAKIAKEVREAYRQENDAPGRAELRTKLERVASLSRELRKLIEDPDVNKALDYGWSALADGAINLDMLQEFRDLRRAKEETPDLLETLNSSSATAVKELALTGQIGNVTTWWKICAPAKIQLAIFGVHLFKIVNGTSKPPTRNNDTFNGFLQQLWIIATRDINHEDPSEKTKAEDWDNPEDWGNPINRARDSGKLDKTAFARSSAEKHAEEIIRSAFRSTGGHGSVDFP